MYLPAGDTQLIQIMDAALADARRFYTEDPWGNRIELLARQG